MHGAGLLLLPPGAPTSEGNNEHGKEEQHKGDAKTPHSGSEVGMAARLIVKHSIQATRAVRTARSDPSTPAPMEMIQAMNATPQAMGCRIIARVKASEVPASMSESWVRSAAAIMCAGA
jgi:hypothetical protein